MFGTTFALMDILSDRHLYSPRVVVVSEERLQAYERQCKESEVTVLESKIDRYKQETSQEIERAEVRLHALRDELAALPAGKSTEQLTAAEKEKVAA